MDLKSALNAAKYIKKYRGNKFFLSVGLLNTHQPFPIHGKEEVNPNYVMPPFPIPDMRETRAEMAEYIKSAMFMDKCFGIVLDAVRDSGIEKETIVFFTTDHGIPFPRMKSNLYDTGVGVSLIMKCPGNKRKGEVVDALVSHIDIFPTLCDYTGLEKPEWLQGRSFKPIIDNNLKEINNEVFSEVTYHCAYEPMRSIRTKRYKFIKVFDEYENYIPSNIDDGACKELFREWDYFETKKDKEMLFDLYLDPVERINLVKNMRYIDIYKDLSFRLKKWMEDTDDPLLQGKIEPPKGSIVCKPTEYSITTCL